MKKTILLLCSVSLLTVACQKESARMEGNNNLNGAVSIHAIMTDPAPQMNTKTSYVDESVFSWVTSDLISLVVENGTKYNRYKLHPNKEGSETDFVGVTLGSEYNETGYAFYPTEEYWNGTGRTANGYKADLFIANLSYSGGLKVNLSATVAPPSDNPLSIIPLIGKKSETEALTTGGNDVSVNSNYNFCTAVGILKITINNIPAGANKLTVSVPDKSYPLSGTYTITEENGKCFISAVSRTSTADADFSKSIEFDGASDASRSFFIALPVGDNNHKIAANKLKLTLYKDDSELVSKIVKQELNIERNTIIETPALNLAWTSMGTGRMIDYFITCSSDIFGSIWANKGYAAVEVQRLGDNHEYRVANPYYVYNGDKYDANTTASQWLYLSVNPNTGDVYHTEKFYTGCKKNSYEMYYQSPNSRNISTTIPQATIRNNSVAIIRLSPVLNYVSSDYYWVNSGNDNAISKGNYMNIVFPGADVNEVSAGTYLINGDPSYSITLVKNSDTGYSITQYSGKHGDENVSWSGNCVGTYNSSSRTLEFNPLQVSKIDDENICFYGEQRRYDKTIVMNLTYDGRLIIKTEFGLGVDDGTAVYLPIFKDQSFVPVLQWGEIYLSLD